MKLILVTGANGQLGQEIKRLEHSDPSIQFIFTDVDELDICREDEIERFLYNIQPDILLNCAAYTAVDEAEDEAELAFRINGEAVKYLARAAHTKEMPFIQISTDFIFDGVKNTPYTTEDSPNPLSVYGKSKLAGEEHVISTGSGIIIRTSWLYSLYGSNFVKTIIRLGRQRDELTVVNDQLGTPTNARDLARMIIRIIQDINPGEDTPGVDIFHYSNAGQCSWYELAKEIIQLSGIDCEIIPVPSSGYPQKAKRPSYSVMDKSGIINKYNVDIPHWKQSLQDCILELISNNKI